MTLNIMKMYSKKIKKLKKHVLNSEKELTGEKFQEMKKIFSIEKSIEEGIDASKKTPTPPTLTHANGIFKKQIYLQGATV